MPLRSNSLTHYTKGTQSPALRRAPTACTHTVSGSISLPSPGFFSPFPHGTGSLSVGKEYLALEDGPPIFKQGFSCPVLLIVTHTPAISPTGLSPPMARLSRLFGYHRRVCCDWAYPRSFATTDGISVDFFSSGYLDVSVPRVSPPYPMYSDTDAACAAGFPIRKSSDQSLFAGSPGLIAGYHALHRLLPPRHPPYALSRLTI